MEEEEEEEEEEGKRMEDCAVNPNTRLNDLTVVSRGG